MEAACSFTRKHIISSSLAARRARYSGLLLLPKVNNKQVKPPTLDTHSAFRVQESTVTGISFSVTRSRREESSASRGTRRLAAPVGRGRRWTTAGAWGSGSLHKRTSKGPGKRWSHSRVTASERFLVPGWDSWPQGAAWEAGKRNPRKECVRKKRADGFFPFFTRADAASFFPTVFTFSLSRSTQKSRLPREKTTFPSLLCSYACSEG